MPDLSQAAAKELIARFMGQANILTIPREFIRMTGSLEAALLLSQLLYWSSRITELDADGWIHKTADQWEEELSLSEYQVRKARGVLAAFGLETKIKGIDNKPIMHYRLNEDVFFQKLLEFLQLAPIPNANLKKHRSKLEKPQLLYNRAETTSIDYSERGATPALAITDDLPNVPMPYPFGTSAQSTGNGSTTLTSEHTPAVVPNREPDQVAPPARVPGRKITPGEPGTPARVPKPDHAFPGWDWAALWAERTAALGYGLSTRQQKNETTAVCELLRERPDTTPAEIVAFLCYRKSCFGVDQASAILLERCKDHWGAWLAAGQPAKQVQNGGTHAPDTKPDTFSEWGAVAAAYGSSPAALPDRQSGPPLRLSGPRPTQPDAGPR